MPHTTRSGRAPSNLIVIGTMKAGTTALHRYLRRHRDIHMSEPKELCFFYDAQSPRPLPHYSHKTCSFLPWSPGNRHRGIEWYKRHFHAGTPVRGESSPGYMSPTFPGVAARMAAVVPDARLLFLVRDPVARAVSQYRHHVRDGAERRPITEALSDSSSHYVLRSRYAERVSPFLRHFSQDRVLIAEQEDLLRDPIETLSYVLTFVGIPAGDASALVSRRPRRPPTRSSIPDAVGDPIREFVGPDAAAFRRLIGRVSMEVDW